VKFCITKDNQLGKGKHTITPPTSPRPEKMAKSPEPTNEDKYDPMELIELNPIEESSNNIPNPPTYAQITKADTDTQPKSNPSTSYKHLECLHCGKSNKDNDSKSQFRKIIIDEFTLLCEKCTQLKENMDKIFKLNEALRKIITKQISQLTETLEDLDRKEKRFSPY